MAIEGYPNGFSDGFITDLSVSDKDKEKLEGRVYLHVTKVTFDSLLGLPSKATILLSEPQYVYVNEYVSYVLLGTNIRPVAIQVKYYNYFRNRYPGCSFYTDGEITTIKSVRAMNKMVGLWMPVMFPMDKLKEVIQ